jgi:glycosyltransferase involved in cell wall biosynthesis
VAGLHAPVRILHLVPADGIGGVETAARSMIGACGESCQFSLLFIEQDRTSARGRTGVASLLGDNVSAFRRATAFDPDVVIGSLWRSVPLALLLRATRRDMKLAFFVHNDVAMHRLDALLSRIAIRAADVVWGDSAATLAARRVPADRARVISFVTDRLVAPDRHDSAPRFVSWGRLSHQKGIDRSITLIADLAGRGLDVRYDIYGPDGGEGDNLAALARDLGIDGRIRFRGPVPRSALPEIAARNRFFLQLSRSEGMCMAAVEAMQLGLVPVATAVGEMARYVRSGVTGILVDPDRIEAAAAAVERLIHDEAAWQRHSDAAARHWQASSLYAQDVCRAARALVYADTGPDCDGP